MDGIVIPSGGGLGTGGLLPSGQIDLTTSIQTGGSPDTISSLTGVDSLGQINAQTSISDFVNTRSNLLTFFNQLLSQMAGDNSANVMAALAQVIGNLPSPQQIQTVFNQAETAATNADTDINSLNTYNNSLTTDGTTITTSGTAIQSDQNNISGVPGSLSTDQTTLDGYITTITNDYTAYQNGTITAAQFNTDVTTFNNNVSTLYGNAKMTTSGMVNNYNDAATQFQTYTGAVTGYNSTVANPPLTQSQYDGDKQAVDDYNASVKAGGNIYPSLTPLPDATVTTTSLSSTQTTNFPSGIYNNSVSWPDPSTYTFTTTDSNGNPVLNTSALSSYQTAFTTSASSAQTTYSNINGTLNSFNTDYNTQSGQLPTLPIPSISTITIPDLTTFEATVLANVVAGSTSTVATLNSLFGMEASINNPAGTAQGQDQVAIDNLIGKATTAVGAIGLGAVGGQTLLNFGGLTSPASFALVFQAQMSATNNAVADNPSLSTSAADFWRGLGNYLQSAAGAASILGTTTAFKDATSFLHTAYGIYGPLLAVNNLEGYNGLVSADNYSTTLNSLAAKAAPQADNVQALASNGDLVLAYSTQIHRAALGAQAEQSDQQQFSALYLAGYTANVIDGVVAKGQLTAAQQQSVVNAQGTLVSFLNNNNVSFNTLNNQAQTASAFQAAGQQLAALGVTVSPTALANAQAAFQASLPTGPVTSSQVQQLLAAAIGANVTTAPAAEIANAVQFQFIQNEDSYRIEVQNDFKLNRNVNTAQAQVYTNRFSDALLGDAYNSNVQFTVNSGIADDQNFAEELATLTVNAQQDLIQNNVLDGAPNIIPGTDILNKGVVTMNDLKPVPSQKQTAVFPV